MSVAKGAAARNDYLVVMGSDPAGVRTLPLLWYGALRDPSGYADEARAFLLAARQSGIEFPAREVVWTPLRADPPQAQLAALEHALALRAPVAPFALVHHVVPHSSQPLHDDGPNVTRTMFETDSIPRDWLRPLVEVDEVWVPTEFNVETFQRGGFTAARMRVLPGTLDFALFDPSTTVAREVEGRRRLLFLANFDFTDRKGWDLLLEAWAQAFDPDDDVSLLLKCLAMHTSADTVRRRIDDYLADRVTAPILLDCETLPASELPGLYAAADAFVLPSRGEGWGRPYMEAMAMGVPTIGSRFGANLAFMDDTNSVLVAGRLVPVPDATQLHSQHYRGQRWFEPDLDELADAMQRVARADADVTARAAGARAGLLERFGRATVAARLEELALDVVERWSWRRSRPVACVWRGEWGACNSLAGVNDGIVDSLERAGLVVTRAVPGSHQNLSAAVGVAQQWPPSFEPPSSGPFVLCQPWEFGCIPESWAAQIRSEVDEVWALSEYTKAAYVAAGVSPDIVHVVPCGVDLDAFAPEGPVRALPFPGERPGTVFLFVGGTISRKGVDLLIEAYRQAFTAADDVALVVKAFGGGTFYRGMNADDALAALAASADSAPVILVDDDVPYAGMAELYRAADVLVQPYRAEGFCLPALESLACGVPVVVTAGGPTDEFVPEECCWRIPSRRVPVPAGSFPTELVLASQGFVLEPDVTALTRALVDACDPHARKPRAAAARRAAERQSWARVAGIARERLAALEGRKPIRLVAPAEVPDRRGTLFAIAGEWAHPESWVPGVTAYARAFTAGDEVTLALAADDVAAASAGVLECLESEGIDTRGLADVVVLDGIDDPVTLELAADAVICSNGRRPTRASRILPPEPELLRATAGIR